MRMLCLDFLCLLVVCGCGPNHPEPAPTEPLTVEAWSVLPPDLKFQVPTLERLKEGTPKLQDERQWRQFAATVLFPAKKKELPDGAGK